MKTAEAELVIALRILAGWATGGNKSGNPYSHPEVKQALKLIAKIDGYPPGEWLDARTKLYHNERA